MPYHIPYRGETYPKSYKKRSSPPTPEEKEQMRGCGCGAVVIGLCLTYFAVIDKTTWMVYILLIYLLSWVIIFFAMWDLKKIKLITPDVDQQNHNERDDNGGSSPTDDYSDPLEWPYRFMRAQKSKNEHGIILRKHRIKELGREMNKHRKK